MKRIAYGLVSIAAAIFIGNWLLVNVSEFNDARRGTQAIPQALSENRATVDFPQCRGQWAGNEVMTEGCNENARRGYAALSAAWSDATLSDMARGQIAACWTQHQTRWGPDWMLIGGCAALYDPRSAT